MPTRRENGALLLALAYAGFVSMGLPDGLLGVAWPSIRAGFDVPLDALGALLVATTAGSALSSFSSGRLLASLSLGALLSLSCALTAVALLGYAAAPAWSVMVAFGVVSGLGAGAIDAGLNTWVATRHGPRMLSLLHAFYGVGTTAGPLLMTGILLAGDSWQRGYLLVAVAQLALALGFAATRRRWPPRTRDGRSGDAPAPMRATLREPAARLGAAAFLLYVGLEAGAGAWTYTVLHEARGVPIATAGSALSVFWGALLLARVAFGLLPARAALDSTLRVCMAGCIAGAGLFAAAPGPTATLAGVALLGAACGPVFPLLIASTPARLGPAHTANAVGVQVAASALGQSLVPAAFGWLADETRLEAVPRALLATALALFAVHALLARRAPARPRYRVPHRVRSEESACPDSSTPPP
jgi:fucose permease